MKKKFFLICFITMFILSAFLNIYIEIKNPHFAATEYYIENEEELTFAISYGGNTYLALDDFFQNDDDLWETYVIKGIDKKLCDLDGGRSFWFGVFRNEEVFSFKEDPNKWLLNCSVQESSHDVFFRNDLKLPTLDKSSINEIFVSDATLYYDEDSYELKIDDKAQLANFVEAYKSGELVSWTKQITDRHKIEGSYYIIVSYEDYPFYQKIVDFDTTTNQFLIMN